MSKTAKRGRAKRWLRTFVCMLPGLGLAGWLAGARIQALGQDLAGSAITKSYLNKTTITLPVLLEDRYRAQLQGIHLYIKEGPAGTWRIHEKAPPTQTSFTYRANGDGELWFNIVSIDAAGRSAPADVTKESPALIVVIDTQAPLLNVQPLQNVPEGQLVRCAMSDPNMDGSRTRFYYQTGDQLWRDLNPQAGKSDTFCVPAQAVWTGMIRAVAGDLAGNTTIRELNLGAAAAVANKSPLPGSVAGALPVVPSHSAAATPTGGQTPTHAEMIVPVSQETLVTLDPVTLQPTGPGVPIAPLPGGLPSHLPAPLAQGQAPLANVHKPAPLPPEGPPQRFVPPVPSLPGSTIGSQLYDPAAAAAASGAAASAAPRTPAALPTALYEVKSTSMLTREPSPANRHLATSPRMALDYKLEALGASGVGRVEVWYTRDLGQSWHKLGEDTDRLSPVEITLPGEGLFGVSLVVSNGRGFGANPPRTGDTPDYWIEIDSTRPQADITAIRAADDGALHIAWAARDKNLAEDPIELAYASSREGPWHVIARGLKNDGGYRWTPPNDVGPQAFFRVTVRDQAGNLTNAETTQPVPLDDQSRPRGRVLGIAGPSTRTPAPPLP